MGSLIRRKEASSKGRIYMKKIMMVDTTVSPSLLVANIEFTESFHYSYEYSCDTDKSSSQAKSFLCLSTISLSNRKALPELTRQGSPKHKYSDMLAKSLDTTTIEKKGGLV